MKVLKQYKKKIKEIKMKCVSTFIRKCSMTYCTKNIQAHLKLKFDKVLLILTSKNHIIKDKERKTLKRRYYCWQLIIQVFKYIKRKEDLLKG